jgi:hypothetical protein
VIFKIRSGHKTYEKQQPITLLCLANNGKMHQKHPGLPQRTHSKRHLKKEPTLESEPYRQQQQQHQPVFTVSLVESRKMQQIQKQWARVLHIKHIEYLPLSVVAPTVAGA